MEGKPTYPTGGLVQGQLNGVNSPRILEVTMGNGPKFYETGEFRKLDAQWKKKLKQTGFNDLEDARNPNMPLPCSIDKRTSRFNGAPEVLSYYESALHYLHSGHFDSLRQKAMWQMHAMGDSLQTIALARGLSKSAVNYHIQMIKKRMYDGNGQS
jgi:DNA-binding CsgD family transcriptional regulator